MSEPDQDPDFSDSVTETTDSGLKATVTVLDEAAGDDAGKHQLVLECVVGSKLDEHVASLGHEANGYFFETLVTFWARSNEVTGLWLDPTADHVVILGDSGQITPLKSHVFALASDFPTLSEAVNQTEAAGIEFD